MTGSASTPSSKGTNWLPKGTRLNDTYELDEGVASGGMGEIYRGHNIQTGSSYAIKMIRADFAETEDAMKMFLREAGALNDLFHESIVRYFAFSVDPTLHRPYMVMEFVTGRSLSEIIKSGPMDYEDVRVLGMRLAAGLQVAHARGIIHRDIAPDNILVPDGDVAKAKIIDFGIARQTEAKDGTIIGDGFAGKYNYVSPEQLGMFGGNVGATSDIYSLALVLVEALAGRSLNMRGNQFEVIDKRRSVPDLRHVDTRMQPILTEMLQPDPQDRPQSMTEVAAKLRVRGTSPPQSNPGFDYREETVIQVRREPSRGPSQETGRESSRSHEPLQRSTPPDNRSVGPGGGETVFEDRRPSTRGTPFPRTGSQPPRYEEPTERPITDRGQSGRPPTGRDPVPSYLQVSSSPPVSARPVAETAAPVEVPKKSGGMGGIIAAAVVVLLLAGGGGGYFFLQQQGGGQPKSGPQTVADGQQVQPPQQKPVDQKPQQKASEPVSHTEPGKPRDTTPADGRPIDLARYLANYQGGACFYTNPILVSDSQMVTEGYGHSITPFEQLDQDFRAKTGFEAEIRLRQVVDAQCPIVDFLAKTRVDGPSRPKVEVVDRDVKAGDLIVGEAKAPPGLYLMVMLVEDDGSVKFLGRTDKPDGSPLSFQATAERLTDGGGKPGLIVAISSAQPLDLSSFTGKAFASQVVDKLTADSSRRGDRLASAAQYLVLQR